MARPRKPLLSREAIRDCALGIIDTDGLEALSMRGLAAKLGVQAASLYGHFPSKDHVLDAIANTLISGVDTSDFGLGWQVGLNRWGTSYLEVLREHPNAAPIVAAGAGERAGFLSMADAVHGGLVDAGWPRRYATMVAAAVKYLVIGAATTPFASGFADDTAVYLDRYPNLVDAHLLRQHAETIDAESFDLALNCLIKGLVPLHAEVSKSASV